MKETLRPEKEREVLSLVTGITYSTVPAWYDGTFRDLKMDLILPKHREGHPACPCIVWICGGAFLVMDRSIWMPEMMRYAEAGYVIAGIEYRTCNEVRFPAQLTDVKAAIRHLKAHAERYCIDPDRIVVMGESAGGALACLAGVTAGRKEYGDDGASGPDSSVCGVVSCYGASVEDEDRRIAEPNPNVPEWIMDALLGEGFTEEEYQKSCATHYLDGGNIPPFLLVHGAADSLVPVSRSDRLYEALEKNHIPADYLVVEGAEHGDDLLYQNAVKERILAFLNRVCGK